ncbi:hypothetical protein LVD15_19230 [Fulvivirga maritima]|uniref:hypothetical protein n=1 Tax=Fulvivirga maritima TaxID=2904247 RepID=UPI001F18BEE2|nr:hypothetical protein [Fulvivirga maritima]UII25418.1 hypothetical protein LVD15_19230 [Fulvivirga maritima]
MTLKSHKTSIIIIDNASTLPSLLTYYKKISSQKNIQLIRLKKNSGLNWILPVSMALRRFEKYIVSDADLIPYDSTPDDIIDKMENTLNTYSHINHVGVSLEINDLPNHYPLKNKVIDWEGKFWANKITPEHYIAPVDTTFGMYRKNSLVTALTPSLRLDRPYTFKHVDWYINPEKLTQEENLIVETSSDCSTWNSMLKEYIKKEEEPIS